MAKSAKISLELLIDDKRNKVVLAEADQDFVDVLISLLTLPMGKVVGLLEDHKMILGCFKNLNKSVADIGIEHFETEACKSMLVNPKSTNGFHYKRLKLNMGDPDDTSLFVCPNLYKGDTCASIYSMFNSSKCRCGALRSAKIDIPEEQVDTTDGVFVSCRTTFIVTNDLKVRESSIGVIMQVLNDQGYLGLTDLRETLLDVGLEEVVNLLGCLFTSETPLTSTFLSKNNKTKMDKTLSRLEVKSSRVPPPSSILYSVKVYLRKFDREILYAECDDYFIDSLVSFLVLPLGFAYFISTDNANLNCVGNLCKSPCRGALSFSIYDFYKCKSNEPFIGSITQPSSNYACLIPSCASNSSSCTFARSHLGLQGGKVVYVSPNNPKVKTGFSPKLGNGFMKRNTKFIVSNDLVIYPMKSASIIDFSKKMKLCPTDLEEHQISISKTELISILRASLISSSALTIGLSDFLTKKVKEEA